MKLQLLGSIVAGFAAVCLMGSVACSRKKQFKMIGKRRSLHSKIDIKGIKSDQSTCYLNSLLSCLVTLPAFKEFVYSNYTHSPVIAALAIISGRKDITNTVLDPLPVIDLTLRQQGVEWDWGRYQDLSEIFFALFNSIPDHLLRHQIGIHTCEYANVVGSDYRYQRYDPRHSAAIVVHSKEISNRHHSVPLQSLIQSSHGDVNDIDLDPAEHFDYFTRNNLDMSTFSRVQAKTELVYSDPGVIVPVYIDRSEISRNHHNSQNQTMHKARIDIPDEINFENGTTHVLVAFATFDQAHYVAYVQRSPSQWLQFNDAHVSEVRSESKMKKCLQDHGVFLVYMEKRRFLNSRDVPEMSKILMKIVGVSAGIDLLIEQLPKTYAQFSANHARHTKSSRSKKPADSQPSHEQDFFNFQPQPFSLQGSSTGVMRSPSTSSAPAPSSQQRRSGVMK